ncbi:sensor domain-containing protein [Streptomyces parvus]|uniref:sensor domain-containing protein n=1 Tax=Streptomyces parvus TaxID=66428 RepID=UPI0037F2083B
MTGDVGPAVSSWPHRHGLSPARGAALAALSAVGLLCFVPMAVAAALGAGGAVLGLRRLPLLRRRLAGAWCGVDIPAPYAPPVSAPLPREGGWYRQGRRLYASDKAALRKRRARQVSRDRATQRDLVWLLADPVLCAPVALLPAVLVGSGLAGLTASLWWQVSWPALGAAVLGVPLVLLGFAAGPRALRAHGRLTKRLLSPGALPGDRRAGWWTWPRRAAQGLGAAVLLCLLALCGFLLALLQLVALVLSVPLGLVPVFAWAVDPGRRLTGLWRGLLREWAGADIPAPYRPRPDPPAQRADGHYAYGRQLHSNPILPRWLTARRRLLGDPATWRDLLWLLLNPFVCAVLLLGPAAVVALVVRWGAGGPGLALAVPPAVLAVWVTPYALRGLAAWSALLLAPTRKSQLALRVEQLTATRAEASGVQAAELRRIERDLHDGAQTRLVAIGMTLRAIERRLDGQSAELLEMVAEARENSAAALADLRALVRGVHPPVLAERGLADAVRALALAHPLAVDVSVDLPGRPAPPVAACAYFSVSEALSNAAKHSGAERIRVVLRHAAGALWITVTDDGRGGADPTLGSGLRGIQRRLATFDGLLDVASPPGGPTTLTMELPCVLSSARTSTSSGRD